MSRSFTFSIIAISFFVLLSFSSKAQTKGDTSEYPYWIAMMQDPKVNFFDVQKAFNKYYAKHDFPKRHDKDEGDNEEDEGYNLYKRWEYSMRTKIKPDGTRIPAGQVMKEYNNRINHPPFATLSTTSYSPNPKGNWTAIGPLSVPINRTGYEIPGMGRINAIAFDPVNAAKFYIGAPSGGLWMTSDSGFTWKCLTDGLPTLGVSAVAIDPNAPGTIYIGTGDRDDGSAPGLGVMKSTDSGNTWASINSTMGDVTVSKMLISPVNSKVIITTTSGGIFRSADGGNSWVETSPDSYAYKDLAFKPHHPNVVYAESWSRFFRSSDSGKTFTQITNGISTDYRGAIGVTPADTNYVYFILTNEFSLDTCYLSTDGGSSFTAQCGPSTNVMDWSDNGSGTGGQAWYDLDVAVDTTDKTMVYVGGVNVFQSTSSGANWTVVAHWTPSSLASVGLIHADQHAMAINPLNNRLYAANDGGIYYTPDSGATWRCVSGNIAITQIYKIAQSAVRPDLTMIGCQDNATSILDSGIWYNVIGGDGTGVAMDIKDTMYNYGCYVYGDMYQSPDAGNTYYEIGGYGINGLNDTGDWVTPYALSKNNSYAMFAGYHNLWYTSSLKAPTITWSQISNNPGGLTYSDYVYIEAFDQSSVDTNLLYMSRNDYTLFRSNNVLSSSPSWTNLSSSLPGYGFVVDVKTHPKYRNTVYIIQNWNVYISNDTGNTWVNMTGSLPSIPLNCLLLDSNANSGIYVGTSAGVYYRDSTMSDWILYSENFPVAVELSDMKIYYDTLNSANNIFKVSTYGRGTWQSPLYSRVPVGFAASDTVVCAHSTIYLADTTKGHPIAWRWTVTPATGRTYLKGTDSTSQKPVIRFDSAGYYSIKLISTTAGYSNIRYFSNFIYVRGIPSAPVGALRSSICAGDSTLLVSGGASTFSWTSNPVGFSSSDSDVYVSPTITTTYFLTRTNVCGSKSDSIVINVNPLPSPVAGNDAMICYGNSTTIGTKAVQGNNYSWVSSPSGYTDTLADPVVKPTQTTTYYLTQTITATGCRKSDTVTITVNPLPAANAGSNSVICFGGSATIGSKADSGSTYSWASNPMGYTDTLANPSVMPTLTISYYLTEKVTSTGCTKSDSVVVTVNPLPVVNVGDSQVICNGAAASIGAKAIYGNSYLWASNPPGFVSTLSNPKVSPSFTTTYYLIDTFIATGCTNIDSVTVKVIPLPVANAGSKQAICTGKSAIIGTAPIQGIYYSWTSKPAGYSDSMANATVSPNTTTSYYIKSYNSCGSKSDSVVITVNPIPKPYISVSVEHCAGYPVNFSGIDSLTSDSANTVSWLWSINGKKTTTQNQSHTFNVPGKDTVWLKVTNTNGCPDSVSSILAINPIPSVHWTVSQNINTYTFLANDTTLSANDYQWAFGDNDSANGFRSTHIYSKDSTYPVSLIITDKDLCSNSFDSSIYAIYSGMAATQAKPFSLKIYPNPFTSEQSISYILSQSQNVELILTDITGKQLASLVDETQNAGQHIFTLDAAKYNIEAGMYFLRMIVGDEAVEEKIVRIK